MGQLFKNNATGALAASLDAGATLAMLAAGHGARFPVLGSGDFFLATLVGVDANGAEHIWEVVKCTARATDGLTIERAQEGTQARTWPMGTRLEMRVTAGTLDSFTTQQEVAAATPVKNVAGKTGAVVLDKNDVGLGNVNNTSDADKPVSNAMQEALNLKQDKLTSGLNIKTVNGKSLLGNGNLVIQSGAGPTLDGEKVLFILNKGVYTITNYNAFSQYSVQVSAGEAVLLGDRIELTAPAAPQDVTLTLTQDGAATEFLIPIKPAGVYTPSGVAPAPGTAEVQAAVVLEASAFQAAGVADQHASSDWQLATDAAFAHVVQQLDASTTNKTSWNVMGLQPGQTYYWRVRYRGAKNGVSNWSMPLSLRTAHEFFGLIGVQGALGFGVGVYPGALPSGFSEMQGTRDKASDNYGNYQYSDGSVMVFVPRFYYRFANVDSPRHAAYGANAIDIAGIDTFATEAAANAAGYALHRAFKDGGTVKHGFFIDKYMASKNAANNSCVSVKGATPVGLTSQGTGAKSYGMTTAAGEGVTEGRLSDAVLLSRARGVGRFNCASIFMQSALAFLSLAHAQASSNTTHCAWYDATHNFPKGQTSNALSDINDPSVVYELAEQYAFELGGTLIRRAKTGSATPFAKTTHNGQSSGVADLSGGLTEVRIGVTYFGNNANEVTSAGSAANTSYCLKDSVALADLTHTWNAANSVWQSQGNIKTLYEEVGGGVLMRPNTVGYLNANKQMFASDASGPRYLATCCGMPIWENAIQPVSNLFGSDMLYATQLFNAFPCFGGHSSASINTTGMFHMNIYARYKQSSVIGFRAAAYGD